MPSFIAASAGRSAVTEVRAASSCRTSVGVPSRDADVYGEPRQVEAQCRIRRADQLSPGYPSLCAASVTVDSPPQGVEVPQLGFHADGTFAPRLSNFRWSGP